VFSTGGGEEMARREGLTFLGSLPVDTELVTLLDAAEVEVPGKDGPEKKGPEILQQYASTSSAMLFKRILERIVARLGEV